MKKYNIIYLLIINLTIAFSFSSCNEEDKEIEFKKVPVANEPQGVQPDQFVASWESVFRASGYELDVSENESFSSFLPNYNSKLVNKFEEIVTGLDNNTSYFYRVRAILNGQPSENSNIVQAKTRFIPDEIETLKSSASNFFVGVAVNPDRIADASYKEVYEREFNSLTAENAMKMRSVFVGLNGTEIVYDWSKIDAIVNYAEENNMNVHGHVLVWHESIPDVLQNFPGTDEEFETIIKNYITTVLTRYKGKIDSWDVVNEAISDNSSSLRPTLFRQRMGSNYVQKCFQFARDADPDVILFYNDYNMVTDGLKRSGALNLVDGLMANNLIDGVGYQMHININTPNENEMQSATNELINRDLLIHYSELDVRTNVDGNAREFSEQLALAQRDKVSEVTRVFNSIPEKNKYALTIWGLKDDDTWIRPRFSVLDWPLLFDDNFDKKEAYFGFIEGLQ